MQVRLFSSKNPQMQLTGDFFLGLKYAWADALMRIFYKASQACMRQIHSFSFGFQRPFLYKDRSHYFPGKPKG